MPHLTQALLRQTFVGYLVAEGLAGLLVYAMRLFQGKITSKVQGSNPSLAPQKES